MGGNGKPKAPRVKMRVDHKTAVRAILEVIADTPMDDDLKYVVTWLKWGENPKVFKPMTYQEVATRTGCTLDQVRVMEEAAKYLAKEHLGKVGIVTIHSKHELDSSLIKRIFKK